ncbi:hypothetical protein [Aurantibacillus circumpalustris]|uniref:hypothetical protein n=1 Tax=Aurantibacillus circumpalustris TaxID=3036359 RepID=UPI00295B5255|nr:hypothetical protein [Aurantibacillus circumpalustris]
MEKQELIDSEKNVAKKLSLFFRENINPFFRKKLKGGALYVSILVSIIIGVVLTFFILIAQYNQRNVTTYTQLTQLYYNLKSAFQIAQSAYFSPEQNYIWIKNQENDDSIRVKKLNWGAYLLISAETKNRHQYLSQAGIYGTYMSSDTGLLISDNSRPVGLSGNIVFKSNCYLPKAGIKPAYIEGQSYVSSSQNSSYIKQSPYQIPHLTASVYSGLKEQLSNFNSNLDSSVKTLPETYSHSFNHKTIVWQNPSALLSRVELVNNIKLVAENIEIDSSAHLNNILIVCKKARFKKGFKGKIHVIASDSISMEEGCEFNYPSSFVLLAAEGETNAIKYIQFNKNCRFYGGVLAVSKIKGNANDQKVFVKLHAESEVNGFVYSSDYIHLEGLVNATVIANKLLLKTPSAVYENHLLSCEINPKKHSSMLTVPLVFNERAKLLCCETIN